MEETERRRKKPGPVAGPPRVRYMVLLDEEPAEWGKHQAGGLSELVRRLLREAYEKARAHGEG